MIQTESNTAAADTSAGYYKANWARAVGVCERGKPLHSRLVLKALCECQSPLSALVKICFINKVDPIWKLDVCHYDAGESGGL